MAESSETDRASQIERARARSGGSRNVELIDDPIFQYRVKLSRAGDFLRGEFWVETGGGGKTEHHPTVEERFRVLDGEIRYRANGRKQIAGPGTEFTIPAGVRHSFMNSGDATAHVLVEMAPALEMENLFRDAAALGRGREWIALGRRGFTTGLRSLLDLADFLERYREIFVPVSPPRLVQRIAVPPLARLARRRRRAVERATTSR